MKSKILIIKYYNEMVKGKIQLCSLFAVLLSSPRYFAFMHKS